MRKTWIAIGFSIWPYTSNAETLNTALGWGDTRDYDLQNLYMDCGAPEEAVLVASFPAPKNIEKLYRVEGHIDFCAYGTPLPAWWRFDDPLGCRLGDLQVSADFTQGPSTHTDYWQGNGNAEVEFIMQSPGRARISVAAWIDPELAGPLTPGAEIYAFKVRFLPPDGECFGCPYPMCFMLNDSITLIHSQGIEEIYSTVVDSYARWQSDSSFCPFIVSVDPSSWGSVKAKYREP